MGLSFDLGVRKIYIQDQEIQLYYVNGLCDTRYVITY
ncbi:stage V sporulation protein AF [Bacillus safensis FO-36b] [Bacillus safensis subsp. safensis]